MKIDKQTFERWKKYSELFLHERGKKLSDVTDLKTAWDIAHYLQFPQEAYKIDSSIHDQHITTALKKIFGL